MKFLLEATVHPNIKVTTSSVIRYMSVAFLCTHEFQVFSLLSHYINEETIYCVFLIIL